MADRASHVATALARVRAVAAGRGLPGTVLTTPGAVAWATGGANPPIDRSAPVDVVWLAVGPERATVVTTDVEAPRVMAEQSPDLLGLDVVSVSWWDAAAMVAAAADALRAGPGSLGSDGHPAFGADLSVELTRARMPLDEWEQDQLRALGQDAATAVEAALRAWEPGEQDRAVAARVAASVEAAGATAPVLLVGGDERLRRFRHPVAVGAPVRSVLMAVLVAARGGHHVALTRYAAARLDDDLAGGLAATRRVHRAVLRACRPGATAGAVLDSLAGAYADVGAPGAWREHYQGGPIGYAQREFEIAPVQTSSPWWGTPLPEGCAVAWNPSLPGGAKDEDTYLVRDGQPEPVTMTIDWPTADDVEPARPGVLAAGT